MGKASSAKKVARASRTGGGASRRGSTPWSWYAGLAGVVALLGALLVVSVLGNRGASATDPPRVADPDTGQRGDHWHAAYGVFVCDKFLEESFPDQNDDALGIHSHEDGLIHIHPYSRRRSAGENATLGRFAEEVGMELSEDTLGIPGGETYENGEQCGDKPGKVQLEVDGKLVPGNPADHRLAEGQKIAIAFAPEGTDIPDPPTANNQPTDLPQGQPVLPTVPGQQPPEASVPPGAVPSSVPPAAGAPPASAPPASSGGGGAAPPTSAATSPPTTGSPTVTSPQTSVPPASVPRSATSAP